MRAKAAVQEVRVIDLDTVTTSASPQPSQWLSSLTTDDEKVLLNGGWLSDLLINAGQRLIQRTYPHVCGLQDIALGHTLAFDVMHGEFVQVLHTGKGHWVTISTIGCQAAEVDVFDSMCPALTGILQRQIAALLCTQHDVITVRYIATCSLTLHTPSGFLVFFYSCMHHLFLHCCIHLHTPSNLSDFFYSCRYKLCQLQDGSGDCGLFALAFAAVLAASGHPSAYLFDQQAMRRHLHMCLSTDTFSPFPTRRIGRVNKKKARMCTNVHVYCTCRMPASFGKTMIQCAKCRRWYHLDLCVVASEQVTHTTSQWFCSTC